MAKATDSPATDPSTPAEPSADKEALRAEFEALHEQWALSVTPASPDPKDTRKAGEPLTAEESKRLHALHSLI